MIRLKGRVIVPGRVEGEALVSAQPLSFYGGVNPETGVVVERGHQLEGLNLTGKILVFPYGKGSTVGSYVLYAMAKRGTAPKAILNRRVEPVVAAGCILGGIPLLDRFNLDPVETLKTGFKVRLSEDGRVEAWP